MPEHSLNNLSASVAPQTFAIAFKHAPIGMALLSPQGQWLVVNDALCLLLGYSADELTATDLQTVTHPEDWQLEKQKLESLVSGTTLSYELEKRYLTKTQNCVTARHTVSSVRDADGNVQHHVVQVMNITEESRAKQALNKAASFQRLIIEHSRDLLFVKDEQFRLTLANKAFLNLYPANQRDRVIGRTTVEDYPPAEAEAFLANDRYAFAHGHHETQEIITFPDGSERTLLTSKTRFSDAAGQRFILGVARDITPLKTAEAKLLKHSKLLELAEKTANLGHWRLSLIDQSLYWSDEIFNIHGVSKKTYQPDVNTAIDFYHPDDRSMVQQKLELAIARQENFEFELRLISPDNEITYVHSRGWPELDCDGGVSAVFGTFQDITQRKEAESALVAANCELEKFAYVASHDLRSPLRAIGNLTHWIAEDLEPGITEDMRGKLDLLRSRVDRMDQMLNDILAYSRAGRISEEPVQLPLEHVVQDIVSQLHAPGFSFSCAKDLPVIRSPRGPLDQIFDNLLVNAVKHHDQDCGSVSVTWRNRGGMVELAVTDDGPGIAEQYHAKVFEMFQTLKSRDRVEGTGLGMPLVRKLVESHGGQVWIECREEGQGTSVRFTWPKNQYQRSEAAA